jgi:23S rRNA (cytosine1962-C5)-methyltransferase
VSNSREPTPTEVTAVPVTPSIFPPVALEDHSLLDSGLGWKLERFGKVVLARPDPQALWRRRLPEADWNRADLTFERESDRGGRWRVHPKAAPRLRGAQASWDLPVRGAQFLIRPTPFKHVGLFPEQSTNWSWVEAQRGRFEAKPKLLNLFGYTGAATVLAAQAGYAVTHVDASKASVAWAKENAQSSGLAREAVRWITEDAVAFARREVRRGNTYQGILLDPPHYGRGPKGEKWIFEEGLSPLLEACSALLAENSFLVLSTYAIGYSPLAFTNLLAEIPGGAIQAGELVLQEEARAGLASRDLPCGFCARWSRA